MTQYILKILISATLLVAISEVAKRSSFWAATLASLPVTSILAFVWLYLDSGETEKVAQLSYGIFWLVVPSLTLFITFPFLLRWGLGFWLSLVSSCFLTLLAYFGTMKCLAWFNVQI